MDDTRLVTLDPGHFHAALVQKEMPPGVSPRVHVYGELGPDLLAHLGRVAGFNTRAERPTAWELEVHAGSDPLARLLADRAGDVVVLAGRNRGKIDKIRACVAAGFHVLSDKPWVIDSAELPKLHEALNLADAKGLIAYDVMTERFEITSVLQRELVNDPDVFGTIQPGTAAEPGVFMESVHGLLKTVAGAPLRRPAWFFDVDQQGEGLTDVGTHLVDLVNWIVFAEQPVGEHDVAVSRGERWPTVLSRADFGKVTGEDFPAWLVPRLDGDRLPYFCNTRVDYTVRGVVVRLDVRWDYELKGGDTHFAVFRGSRSRVEVRQGPAENYRPELYVVTSNSDVRAALQARVARWQTTWPGVTAEPRGEESRVSIPDTYRIGHEAHFAEVTRLFLSYLRRPQTLPAWEKPNMLAKYAVTTHGVRLARRRGPDLVK